MGDYRQWPLGTMKNSMLGINMKYKILVLLCTIALASCFKSKNSNNDFPGKECFVDGKYGSEPLAKFHRYNECILKDNDLKIIYPCPMNSSLVYELANLFGSDSTVVKLIGGGSLCDEHLLNQKRNRYCSFSNPQNGCDTLNVWAQLINNDLYNVFFYTVIRNENKWEIINSGHWEY